jgi:hypothetical protein
MIILEPKFNLGETCATPAVIQLAATHGLTLYRYLRKHHCGEWGDLSDEDKAANDHALENGDRILSAYHIADRKIYIITEHDRSRTTLMLAEEY